MFSLNIFQVFKWNQRMPLVFEEYKQQANEKKMQYEEALKVKLYF